MKLWDWIEGQLFPLFGTLPEYEINFGHLGTFTTVQFLQFFFWVAVGYVAINVLVLLPYEWCMRLLRRKGWKK